MTTPIRREESQIRLSGAGPRHRRAWLPEAPTQSMILVHGYAEHCGRYDEMAMYFAGRGFAVHAYDQSGHGRSPGRRGDVDQFDRMLDELAAFVEFVSAQHAERRPVVVGHSMGGLVAASTCAFRSPEVERLVLSGALLELGPGRPAWKRSLARLLVPLGPWVGLSVGLDAEGLSRDPEVGRRYTSDPFVRDRMTARFATGMMSMIERAGEAAARIDRPVLILHGGADPMCAVSGSRAFHAGLPPSITSQSRLHIYPELRHEVFQEPERERVWQDMLDWLRDDSASNQQSDQQECATHAGRAAAAAGPSNGVEYGG